MTRQKEIKIINHVFALVLVLLISACGSPGGATRQDIPKIEVVKNAPKVLEMQFKKGQLLSLISVLPKQGSAASDLREVYLKQAFGLGREFGLKPTGSLPVVAVGAGNFSPTAVSFFSWPSALAEARFNARPEWAAIKASRPEGWDELRIHDVELERDVTLRFDAGKTYTMATAWLNPEHPEDYDLYLANIEEAVRASGGRFIYQMQEPRFTSLATERGAPGRITFVEWDSPQGLEHFQTTTGFKSNVHYLQSGTTGFELIIFGLPAG